MSNTFGALIFYCIFHWSNPWYLFRGKIFN